MVECPRCGGDSTKFGLVPSVKAGKMQRLRCKECGHTFYEKNGRKPTPTDISHNGLDSERL